MPKKRNLTTLELDSLDKLSKNNEIVIKPADKGSAIVILNKCDYIYEANQQLSNRQFYSPVNHDLSHDHTTEINSFLTQMHTKSEISDKCLKYLCEQHTKPGRFYLLPKIHKNKLPPPGRPIISAIGSPTEKISQFVDFFLQPMLPKMKSYVKDTGHFLHLIDKVGPLPDNIIIGTLDVTSLYTNVPLNGAKEAVQNTLSEERNPDSNPSNQSLIELLEMIFSMNNFTFSDGEILHHYTQNNGVSMGSKSAPSVACLFMGDFERKYVYTYRYQPLLWLRYVDDIFYAWQYGEDNLTDFITYLNSRERSIQLTGGYSPQSENSWTQLST